MWTRFKGSPVKRAEPDQVATRPDASNGKATPPATTTAQLEVVYSSVPTGHTISGNTVPDEVIKVDDSWANCIIDYILYRAYSKDAEYAANSQRAAAHYQAMQASLGVKTQSDQAVTPQEGAPRPPTTNRNM